MIHVSTSFFPLAILPRAGGQKPNMILLTSDSVYFFVHHAVLQAKSYNRFGDLLEDYTPPSKTPLSTTITIQDGFSQFGPTNSQLQSISSTSSWIAEPTSTLPVFYVAESSPVINVLLHVAYGMPCERFAPSLDTILKAFLAFPKYGLAQIMEDDPSYIPYVLQQHAPTSPIEVYALAAHQNLESICVMASQHTLAHSLDTLSEANALIMGPGYLRRLFFLHLGLEEALKRVMRRPPDFHAPTDGCSLEQQEDIRTRWDQAGGMVLVEPNITTTSSHTLIGTFGVITSECPQCRVSLNNRVAVMVNEWAGIRKTI